MTKHSHAMHDAEEMFRGFTERHSVAIMLLLWLSIIGVTIGSLYMIEGPF